MNVTDLGFIKEYSKSHYSPILLEDSARLLESIVSERQPKSILEIGTSIGYSGAIMLLSSLNARLNTIEYNESVAAVARRHFEILNLNDRTNIFIGDAKIIVPLLNGTYDLIFVDGPKGQYIEFLPRLLNLMSKGSVLICDNVLFRGIVESLPNKRHRQITIARRLSEFIGAIKSNPLLDTAIHNIGDGVSVSTMI